MLVNPQLIINSVVTGSIYVLISIGLTMVYRVLRFANFSHAELVTFGRTQRSFSMCHLA